MRRRPKPTRKAETSIPLSPKDFAEFQGICAITMVKIQQIQQQAGQAIAVVQQERQRVLQRLVKKYQAQGLRLDVEYVFDEQTRSLVVVQQP